MSNKSFKYLGISLILLLAHAHATSHFVRSGASGNGTSWANAWGNVSSISWSALSAGDTVCVAGGTYSGVITFGNSGTSGNPITVKRATSADAVCGSGTAGWNPAYDAQIIVGGITASNNFVTIDGAVWHGITINLGQCPAGQNCSGINVGGPTNGIILRYIEVSGPCGPAGCAMSGDPRSIDLNRWNGSSYDLQNNMLIQYNDLHGACNGIWSAHSTNLIIEHSRFADINETITGCHENVLITQDSTGTFRYNEITNWKTEGILNCPTGSCSSSWDIYGNVWHDPASGGYPRVLAYQNGSSGPYRLYNNTFVNIPFTCFSDESNGAPPITGSAADNNLYFGNVFADCGFPVTEDYAYSDKALSEAHGQGNAPNPFLDSTAKTIAGYHLKAHTTAGLNLGSPYNADDDGNPRVNWDRGAFEYSGGNGKVNPPTSLTVVSAQ